MRIQRRLVGVTTAAVVGLLGLSGCGSDLAPDLHPGTAAIIGDTTISISDLDAKADELCAFGIESGQISSPLPMSSVRSSYLQTYIDYHLAQEFLAEKGVTDDPAFVEQVRANKAKARDESKAVPAAVRDIYLDMATMTSYLDLTSQIGGDEFAKWLSEAQSDVVRDPRFPTLELDGQKAATGDLSVPVSDLARFAADPQSQQEYDAHLASLPDAFKCGAPQA